MHHTMPQHMDRDAVAVRADADLALQLALAALPDRARALAARPGVTVVTWEAPRVPEKLYIEMKRRTGYRGDRPSVCKHDDADGTALLVIGMVEDLGHEMIHLAQAYASDAAIAASFQAVVADGARLAQAARIALRAGVEANDHRDLAWCRLATCQNQDIPPTEGKQDLGMINTFNLHAEVHPVATTRALGQSLGLDRHATMAAMFAYACDRNGTGRPRSAPAMECVAYRYERDLAALDTLFASALANTASRG